MYAIVLKFTTVTRHLEGDDSSTGQQRISSTERSTTPREDAIPDTTTVGAVEETTTRGTYQVTYVGDYETVDDYLRRQAESTDKIPVSTAPTTTVPDICEGSFDAISVFRNELFVFKGEVSFRIEPLQGRVNFNKHPRLSVRVATQPACKDTRWLSCEITSVILAAAGTHKKNRCCLSTRCGCQHRSLQRYSLTIFHVI